MLLSRIILTYLLLIATDANSDSGYCDISTKSCNDEFENVGHDKLLFYDVNPPEGFNLRRDVYMRFAIMLSEAKKSGKRTTWRLVLPPWHNIYHWKSDSFKSKPEPWSRFFEVDSLKTYSPVVELYEIFTETPLKSLEIDTMYVLQNYENAFENGIFEEKWEIVGPCEYDGNFWGYNNITVKEIICVQFQGKISMLWELVLLHPNDQKVMFAHGEIPLHDTYGSKSFWDCRKSMKFNKELVTTAQNYISTYLGCKTKKCSSYVSMHWRRQDFARSRGNDVPSIMGTARQINKAIKKNTPIKKVFIASDATVTESNQLKNELNHLGYEVHNYMPSKDDIDKYKDGGIAIIDQIISSRSAYFIGTHESTFSYRIQEEREILGFDSSTTFNRLCPDSGHCEKSSKWTIMN